MMTTGHMDMYVCTLQHRVFATDIPELYDIAYMLCDNDVFFVYEHFEKDLERGIVEHYHILSHMGVGWLFGNIINNVTALS